MTMHRIVTAVALAALAILLGVAALRSKTAPAPVSVTAPAIEPTAPARDGDYVWDPVDRYWEKDRGGR